MKQQHASGRKCPLLFYALSLTLLFILAAMTGEESVALSSLSSPSDQGPGREAQLSGDTDGTMPPYRAEMLAQLGVKACVPRPSLEPPPAVEGERTARDNDIAAAGQRPCPEGFVPQPVERRTPRRRRMPAPPVADKSLLASADAPETDAYYYSGANQWVTSPGSSAFFTQHLPWLMPRDYHTLAEMAVESADERQIVEVGWIVDRIGYGDETPRLFVFHWINGAGTCYNGCGWVQTSSTRFPGMKLAYDGIASQYMIEYRQGNWWIGFQGEWIGYFPGSLWNGTFTSAGFIQWFGEVSVRSKGSSTPLSSMGNYYQGTSADSDAARISQIALFDDSGSLQGTAALSFYNTDTSLYNTRAGSEPNEFWYGGHGGAP